MGRFCCAGLKYTSAGARGSRFFVSWFRKHNYTFLDLFLMRLKPINLSRAPSHLLSALLVICQFAAHAGARGQTHGHMVQSAHSGSADSISSKIQQLEKAGIHDASILTSPIKGSRTVCRRVSKTLPTYSAARLAAREAQRIGKKSKLNIEYIILKPSAAGVPMIK